MSNNILSLIPGFIKTPLQNGVGRYICQLQRVTLKFCKSHGDSRGIRDFIQKNLIDFARENPGIVVYVKPRRHRAPVIVAEYLNGDKENISCHNLEREEVVKWLNLLKTQAGNHTNFRLRKLWHTDYPSIQGPWTPFTFKDPKLNLASFPDEELSKPAHLKKSATEVLFEMFKEQQAQETSSETSQKVQKDQMQVQDVNSKSGS